MKQLETPLLPYHTALAEIQNADGGWGYHPGSVSRVEPTCWAIRALTAAEGCRMEADAAARALKFLLESQRKDGCWSATPEMETGNWVTSLACAVLRQWDEAREAVASGLTWLSNDVPLTGNPWIRLIRKLKRASREEDALNRYQGWGWTPRTSSWIEPTAFALLALKECAGIAQPPGAASRRESGENLLYARVFPDGGWSSDNPLVYSAASDPLVLPTAWALVALRSGTVDERLRPSLGWLERQLTGIQSPGSLAAAILCLESYGKKVAEATRTLQHYSPSMALEDGTHVLAWVCLAMDSGRSWPSPREAA